MLRNEGWMSCEVKLVTLYKKKLAGSDENMDAVNSGDRQRGMVLDMR